LVTCSVYRERSKIQFGSEYCKKKYQTGSTIAMCLVDADSRYPSELAAKHLPQLVERWRADDSGPLTPTTRIINVVSYTYALVHLLLERSIMFAHLIYLQCFCSPYFVRFIGTPAGQGIAALYTHRLALSCSTLSDSSDPDTIAECCQFLATLLLVQGITDVDAQDKQTLLPALRAWIRKPAFRGRLASEASERVVWLLTSDR
jgi:hypothetical protein